MGTCLHRLSQIQWRQNRALAASAVLRGTYHLYQGFGGLHRQRGNGSAFRSSLPTTGTTRPARGGAHVLIDTGAFVGYVVLRGRVSWLP